mgnify:FL=1|nr:MAG TPA: Flagellar and Swarming motility protein [Caudoviricetes sp.]
MNYFIELHRYDGEPVLINTRNITTVVRSISETKATMVYFNSDIDDFATVTESYEEVKKLLATVECMYKEEE